MNILVTSLGVFYLVLSIIWLIIVVTARDEVTYDMIRDRKRSVTLVLLFMVICILTNNSAGMWIFGTTSFLYILSMDIAKNKKIN